MRHWVQILPWTQVVLYYVSYQSVNIRIITWVGALHIIHMNYDFTLPTPKVALLKNQNIIHNTKYMGRWVT